MSANQIYRHNRLDEQVGQLGGLIDKATAGMSLLVERVLVTSWVD